MLFVISAAKQKPLKWPGVSDLLFGLCSSRMVNSKATVHTANRLTRPTPRPAAPRAATASRHMDHPMDSNHLPVVCYFLPLIHFCGIQTKVNFSSISKVRVYSVTLFLLFVGGYNATPAAPQGYSQPVQGYGASSYDSSTAAASSTSNSQASYGGQASYGAQSAYPGYGQQPASAAPPRYWAYSVLRSPLKIDNIFELVSNCNLCP